MGDRVSSSMVPLGKTEPVGEDQIQALCQRKGLRLYKVHVPELSEPRMQNIVVLATVSKNGLIPNVLDLHYRRAMEDLLTGEMLRENMALFDLKSGGD
jgi:indolepyruvate ferredoxin oxidoreductase beta subunit